jgi:hypothetical protein
MAGHPGGGRSFPQCGPHFHQRSWRIFIPTGERRLWPRRVRLEVRHGGRESPAQGAPTGLYGGRPREAETTRARRSASRSVCLSTGSPPSEGPSALEAVATPRGSWRPRIRAERPPPQRAHARPGRWGSRETWAIVQVSPRRLLTAEGTRAYRPSPAVRAASGCRDNCTGKSSIIITPGPHHHNIMMIKSLLQN